PPRPIAAGSADFSSRFLGKGKAYTAARYESILITCTGPACSCVCWPITKLAFALNNGRLALRGEDGHALNRSCGRFCGSHDKADVTPCQTPLQFGASPLRFRAATMCGRGVPFG